MALTLKYIIKSLCLPCLMAFMVFAGCRENRPKNIPDTAKCVAETSFCQIYLDQEEDDSLKVSLYAYDKQSDSGRFLLTTNPNARRIEPYVDDSQLTPSSQIETAQVVTVLSQKDEPLVLLVEYCTDWRNVESFIFTEGRDDVILLPSNRGLLGLSEEENLLIMQSYDYYEGGGRYNSFDAFDIEGNHIASMSAKACPFYDSIPLD